MGTILGPEESAYAGGVFLIDIKLSTEYPWKAPVVKFKTPIYHPNITKTGQLCDAAFLEQWTPSMTIASWLAHVLCLLETPDLENPVEIDVA